MTGFPIWRIILVIVGMGAAMATIAVLFDASNPLVCWLFAGPAVIVAILLPMQLVLERSGVKIERYDKLWFSVGIGLWVLGMMLIMGVEEALRFLWLLLLGLLAISTGGPGGVGWDL